MCVCVCVYGGEGVRWKPYFYCLTQQLLKEKIMTSRGLGTFFSQGLCVSIIYDNFVV